MSYPYPQAPAAPVRRGPHLGWLWLGVAMAVLAAISVVAYVSTNIGALDAGSEYPQSGPGEVTLPLHEGHLYGVYLPAEAWVPIDTLACTVSQQAGAVPLDLEVWDGGWEGGEYEDFGRTWVAAGRFTSPLDGLATVTCEGAASGLLLYPNDETFVVLAAVVVGAGLVGLGGTALAITVGAVRLHRRHQGAAASWPGAYGHYPPYQPYPPYPPYPTYPPGPSPYAGPPYPPASYPGAPPNPSDTPPPNWPSGTDPR